MLYYVILGNSPKQQGERRQISSALSSNRHSTRESTLFFVFASVNEAALFRANKLLTASIFQTATLPFLVLATVLTTPPVAVAAMFPFGKKGACIGRPRLSAFQPMETFPFSLLSFPYIGTV